MRTWRLLLILCWILLLIWPLGTLATELARSTSAWQAWQESDRLLTLARHSALLIGGVLVITLPVGTVAALLLQRSDLPGRRLFRGLTALALFMPLPLLASAWQSALGSGGWLPAPIWRTVAPGDPDYSPTGISWKPWAQGLPAAIWVHAAAGLPWMIWLAGRGFAWVERHLEEDALTHGGVLAALRYATLPRAAPAIGAAGLWVALQCATEISVTDMMQVRTFAEEVYTQFARPDPPADSYAAHDSLARALAVAVPPALIFGLVAGLLYYRWERRLPPLDEAPEPFCLLPLGRWRWPAYAAVAALYILLLGLPIASLVWKTGQVPPGDTWSPGVAAHALRWATRTQALLIVDSLFWAYVTGFAVTALALLSCWLARDRRWARGAMLGLLVLACSLPGPVIGLGLKETINQGMNAEEWLSNGHMRWFQAAMYNGPSPMPVMWVEALRFLPIAVAVLWPAVRSLPRELFDAARTDGATPSAELGHVVIPSLIPALLRVALAVAALSLGELSAGKLVETPGGQTFSHEVFTQMHYGVGNHLAAMCLLLLAAVAVPALTAGWIGSLLGAYRLAHQAE
jgi:iron(III) transport system permease protein